jgi:hypothetical protein
MWANALLEICQGMGAGLAFSREELLTASISMSSGWALNTAGTKKGTKIADMVEAWAPTMWQVAQGRVKGDGV